MSKWYLILLVLLTSCKETRLDRTIRENQCIIEDINIILTENEIKLDDIQYGKHDIKLNEKIKKIEDKKESLNCKDFN